MARLNLIKKEENIVNSKILNKVLANMKREKMLSISNILVMTITFLFLGIFIYVIAISQTALGQLERQVQLSVFFKDDFSESNILTLQDKLQANPRISGVKYVSKQDAFKIFSEINKDQPILLESISPEILPASLEVKTFNISELTPLADELSKTDGVEEVRYFKDVVAKFKHWSSTVYIVGFILVLLFFVISYSVIINTLRTTITSKGIELEIMKLVGAADKYIKNPLIYQGMVFGFISGAVAGLLLLFVGIGFHFSGAFSTGFSFGFLPNFYIKPLIFSVVLLFVLTFSGVCLGYASSVSAVKKYLKY